MEVRRVDLDNWASGLYRNSPHGLNISSIRVSDQIRDPENPITLRPFPKYKQEQSAPFAQMEQAMVPRCGFLQRCEAFENLCYLGIILTTEQDNLLLLNSCSL